MDIFSIKVVVKILQFRIPGISKSCVVAYHQPQSNPVKANGISKE